MSPRRAAQVALATLLLAGAPSAVRGAPPSAASPARSAAPTRPAPPARHGRPAGSASAPVASASASPPASASAPAPPASAPPAPPADAPPEADPGVTIEAEGSPEAADPGERVEGGVAAVLWPTATPTGDGEAGGPLRLPSIKDGVLRERTRELDVALAEAAQDLGLLLDVGARGPVLPRGVRDVELIDEARERKAWVISPRIERDGGDLLVRIVAVPPESRVVLVRTERTSAARLAVRGVVMLRDLVRAHRSPSRVAPTPERDDAPEPRIHRSRTSGRGVLTATLAVFGGYTGYALQTSSRGRDPRLLYPLMALGTGVGLGAATLVADEWELGLGDAWFLTAGATWPTASALLLSAGYDVQPATDRQAFGLLAGIGGMGMATAVLSRRSVGEGGALAAHSGAVLGGFLGGLTELTARGTTEPTPYRGAGYGAAGGWVVGGALGAWLDPSVSRVMMIDLGAGLGALGFAALGSPLLLDHPTANQERAWLTVVMGGAVVGAGVGAWLSRPVRPVVSPGVSRLLPAPGVVATARGVGGEVRTVMGLTWNGVW